jgi:hypothetical protein
MRTGATCWQIRRNRAADKITLLREGRSKMQEISHTVCRRRPSVCLYCLRNQHISDSLTANNQGIAWILIQLIKCPPKNAEAKCAKLRGSLLTQPLYHHFFKYPTNASNMTLLVADHWHDLKTNNNRIHSLPRNSNDVLEDSKIFSWMIGSIHNRISQEVAPKSSLHMTDFEGASNNILIWESARRLAPKPRVARKLGIDWTSPTSPD